jgi:hypothetical protein
MSLAQRKVLVLNKSWTAIGVVTLEKALKKVGASYKDGTPKARIIDCVHDFQMLTWDDWSKLRPQEGEEGMRSVNAIFRIPEVIQYTRYDKLPSQKVHYNRRTIYRRDNNVCQYCGKKKPGSELSLDHVTPRCQGGLTTWENIVVACTDCNARKAGRTPKEAGMVLLSVPKKPKYNFFPGDVRIKSWEQFLGEAYWLTELEHDGD